MPKLKHPSYAHAAARAKLRRQASRIFNAALSKNTHPVYRSYVRRYISFCREFHLRPFPASRTTLHLYAAHWVTSGRAHTTIASIFSAIKNVHRAHLWTWLDEESKAWLQQFMVGIRKSFPHEPKRKMPLTISILRAITAKADLSNTQEAQYITMAFLAHDGLLRACELLQLRLADVTWERGRIRLRVRDSKANKLSGRPEHVYIYPSEWRLCGYSALKAYWRRMQGQHGCRTDFLFPSASPSAPMPKKAWIDYIHRKLATAGINPQAYSGHSFRSGGATDLWDGQCRPRVIQLFGRWLSDAFWLYVRDNPHAGAREVADAFSQLARAST